MAHKDVVSEPFHSSKTAAESEISRRAIMDSDRPRMKMKVPIIEPVVKKEDDFSPPHLLAEPVTNRPVVEEAASSRLDRLAEIASNRLAEMAIHESAVKEEADSSGLHLLAETAIQEEADFKAMHLLAVATPHCAKKSANGPVVKEEGSALLAGKLIRGTSQDGEGGEAASPLQKDNQSLDAEGLVGNNNILELEHLIRAQVDPIVSRIVTKAHLNQMEKEGTISSMVSDVSGSIYRIKGSYGDVTSEIAQKEVCKWTYRYMRSNDRKVAFHPQCIKDLPRDLQRKGKWYTDNNDLSDIGKEWGLTDKQVACLFANNRKRAGNKDPEGATELKKHFSKEVSQKMRKWQTDNPGNFHPHQELTEQTGLTYEQQVQWLRNHKLGRDRSSKRKRTTE